MLKQPGVRILRKDRGIVVAAPAGFHWHGEHPVIRRLANGEVIVTRPLFKAKIKEGTTSLIDKEFTYNHYIARTNPGKGDTCLICLKEISSGNTNSLHLMHRHIINMHPEVVPFEELDDKYIDRISSYWENGEGTVLVSCVKRGANLISSSLDNFITKNNGKNNS